MERIIAFFFVCLVILGCCSMQRRSSLVRFRSRISARFFRLSSTSSGDNIRNDESATSAIRHPPLPLNIYVDTEIRKFLAMRVQDRKARVYLTKAIMEAEIETTQSIRGLRLLVEKKLPVLALQPYTLRYQIPHLMAFPKKFDNDSEVASSIEKAWGLIKGSLQLFVQVSAGRYPPPTELYLQNMNDPDESETYTMLSFYRFADIVQPEVLISELAALWKPLGVLGRVYIAHEGINAQLAVPSNILTNFRAACESKEVFRDLYLNVDHTIARAEYQASLPFKALHIRLREQIVADGFEEPLDWQKSGREIGTKEWHEQLSNPEAIVLDCRNSYESDVGFFEGAEPLNTTFFRESWDVLNERLKNTPKDAAIMTYCTGGIRCVKINAYLEQKLGFSNVGRLRGGVISYARELIGSDELQDSPSKFRGANYVFDERMGVRITKDLLSLCETCGTHCNDFTNCFNNQCHVRFIQCLTCSNVYRNCCSESCALQHSAMQKNNKHLLPRISVNGVIDVTEEG